MDLRTGEIINEAEMRRRFSQDEIDRHFRPVAPSPRQAMRGKIGRNDPCPCGSGGKFKHCCLQKPVTV